MTKYTNLKSVITVFEDREGVEKALVVSEFPEGSYAEIVVTDDGLSADFMVYAPDMSNGSGYGFKDLDNTTLVWMPKADGFTAQIGASAKAKSGELGSVGRWTLYVLMLALVAPAVALLWHWTAGVITR